MVKGELTIVDWLSACAGQMRPLLGKADRAVVPDHSGGEARSGAFLSAIALGFVGSPAAGLMTAVGALLILTGKTV